MKPSCPMVGRLNAVPNAGVVNITTLLYVPPMVPTDMYMSTRSTVNCCITTSRPDEQISASQ